LEFEQAYVEERRETRTALWGIDAEARWREQAGDEREDRVGSVMRVEGLAWFVQLVGCLFELDA
jgi:hypothetical protein